MINIFIFAILMTASCWAKQFISLPNQNQKIVGGEDAEQGRCRARTVSISGTYAEIDCKISSVAIAINYLGVSFFTF